MDFQTFCELCEARQQGRHSIFVKNSEIDLTEDQRLLKGIEDSRATRLQREEYERLMGDVEWVETVLKPYVAAKWNELE